ncbi:MAG: hypothetical protein V1872_12605 [bacterium]
MNNRGNRIVFLLKHNQGGYLYLVVVVIIVIILTLASSIYLFVIRGVSSTENDLDKLFRTPLQRSIFEELRAAASGNNDDVIGNLLRGTSYEIRDDGIWIKKSPDPYHTLFASKRDAEGNFIFEEPPDRLRRTFDLIEGNGFAAVTDSPEALQKANEMVKMLALKFLIFKDDKPNWAVVEIKKRPINRYTDGIVEVQYTITTL